MINGLPLKVSLKPCLLFYFISFVGFSTNTAKVIHNQELEVKYWVFLGLNCYLIFNYNSYKASIIILVKLVHFKKILIV